MLYSMLPLVADDFSVHPSGVVTVWRNAGRLGSAERFLVFPEGDLFSYRLEDSEGVVFRGLPSSAVIVLKVLEEWVHDV